MNEITEANRKIISSIITFLIKEGKDMMVKSGNENPSKVLKIFHHKYKLNFEELEKLLIDPYLYRTYVKKINEEISY